MTLRGPVGHLARASRSPCAGQSVTLRGPLAPPCAGQSLRLARASRSPCAGQSHRLARASRTALRGPVGHLARASRPTYCARGSTPPPLTGTGAPPGRAPRHHGLRPAKTGRPTRFCMGNFSNVRTHTRARARTPRTLRGPVGHLARASRTALRGPVGHLARASRSTLRGPLAPPCAGQSPDLLRPGVHPPPPHWDGGPRG